MRALIRGALTVVRPATDDDVDRLVAWHADPDVSRYWDGETFTREQMLSRLHREDVDAWIIEAGGEPAGYLQSWWEVDMPRRGGLDGFLLPHARGQGLMPDAARVLAQALLSAGWHSLTVDPAAWNERALRCWTKAGFVEISRHEADEEHREDWVLMRFDGQNQILGFDAHAIYSALDAQRMERRLTWSQVASEIGGFSEGGSTMAPTRTNGKICYLEIPTADIPRSVSFYQAVFGWQIRQRGDGASAFDDGVGEVSGAWVTGRPSSPVPGLLLYVMVDSISTTVETVVAHGGRIVQPLGVDAPELTARFADPDGNVLGLYQEPKQSAGS